MRDRPSSGMVLVRKHGRHRASHRTSIRLLAERPLFTSDEFTFVKPAGWTRASEAEQLTFVDDLGGVLIISTSRVVPAESSEVLNMLLSNAFAAGKRAASNSELVRISDLHESPHHSLRCWTAEARTHDGSVFFSQCVLASKRGVLLATLETPPPEETHRELFRSFMDSVRPAAAS
jgi:hypothetical protein